VPRTNDTKVLEGLTIKGKIEALQEATYLLRRGNGERLKGGKSAGSVVTGKTEGLVRQLERLKESRGYHLSVIGKKGGGRRKST